MTNAEKIEEVFGWSIDLFKGYICDALVDCPSNVTCKDCFASKVKWEDEYKGKINVLRNATKKEKTN